MLLLILRRFSVLVLTMLAMSLMVFAVLETNPEGLARKAIGQFSTVAQRTAWLARENYYVSVSDAEEKVAFEEKGYVTFSVNEGDWLIAHAPEEGVVYPDKKISEMVDDEVNVIRALQVPMAKRYVTWLGKFVVGDFGYSYRYKVPVSKVLWPRLLETGKLIALVLLFMIPLSLLLGVLAGMREGSFQDRAFSFISIMTTSVPEFASAVLLAAVFVFWLGWLPGTSSMSSGFSWAEMVLPVTVVTLYATGYIARITRASMAEVMRSHFIRTARLKGLSRRQVIMRHALRNALITPVTAILLQIPWLLSGVIVVEYFFAYKGFGTLLWEAINNTDPFLIEACAMVSVVVVVTSQLIMDVLYIYINPRIRFQ